MKTSLVPLIVAFTGAGVMTADSLAQNLSDRINHVRQSRMAAEANNTTKAHLLGTLLYTDVTVHFQETAARDAVNHLRTILGIDITARYSDDRTGEGLDPEAPITMNVVNRPAITVLEMLIEQAAGDEPATWQLREGYVEIGTKERLSVPR
jgi:hypothetical protein